MLTRHTAYSPLVYPKGIKGNMEKFFMANVGGRGVLNFGVSILFETLFSPQRGKKIGDSPAKITKHE